MRTLPPNAESGFSISAFLRWLRMTITTTWPSGLGEGGEVAMGVLEGIWRGFEEFFLNARINYWNRCLELGSWPGFRSFTELVLGIERRDYSVNMLEHREAYYLKLAKDLNEALRYALENLPERKYGKPFGWFARIKIFWVRISIRFYFLKAFVEYDDFSRSELPAHVLLKYAFDEFTNELTKRGHDRFIEEMKRDLRRFYKTTP
jgi:hypothetical protein